MSLVTYIKQFCLLCFMFTVLHSPLSLANEKSKDEVSTVTVVGESIMADQDKVKAKKRALQEAFSAALTKTMGSFISAESFTHNYESLERGVFSQTQGYIKNYKVLNEVFDQGILTLKVEVSISLTSIKDDINALGILIDSLGNPGIYVAGSDEGLQKAQSTEVIKSLLTKKGFKLLQSRDKADMIITSTGKIVTQTDMGGMTGVVSSVLIRADWAESGHKIASKIHQTNGAGPNPTHALTAAYQTTTRQAFPDFLDNLVEQWQDKLNNGRAIDIIVYSNDFNTIQQFRNRLLNVFGVKSARVNNFTGKQARINIRYKGTSATLAELLNRVDFDTYAFEAKIAKMNNTQVEVELSDIKP